MSRNSGFTHQPLSKCMFGKCDWPYDTWHICVDPEKPEPKMAPVKRWTEEERREIGERVRATATKRNQERDVKIVELYVEEMMGMKTIAREIGIDYMTVRRVLHKNNVEVRPPGPTVRRPGGVHGAFN